VRIWFDGPVETMFFEVRVGHRIEGSFSFLVK
jgi:hypothetical protein